MMTRADFVGMWPDDYRHYVMDGPDIFCRKTKKNAHHIVGQTWKPGKTMAPSLYRRLHKGRKRTHDYRIP